MQRLIRAIFGCMGAIWHSAPRACIRRLPAPLPAPILPPDPPAIDLQE